MIKYFNFNFVSFKFHENVPDIYKCVYIFMTE